MTIELIFYSKLSNKLIFDTKREIALSMSNWDIEKFTHALCGYAICGYAIAGKEIE